MASDPTTEQASPSTAHAVRTFVHFLRVVRYRQSVLIGSVVVCSLLGGLYFATATRSYQAKASLLVLQTGADITNTTMTAEGVHQGLMPTYERLFSSAVVLEKAIEHLEPQDRIDFEGIKPENWPVTLRKRLSASTIRLTNIIEISYRSNSPRAAVAVVNAVLQSYLEFMNKTHGETAGELIIVFTKEKGEVEQLLTRKQAEVMEARQKFGDLGISSQSGVVHPMVQRVIEFNQALTKAQQARMTHQAALAAIESAVRSGENLDQHLLELESTLGRALLMSNLGFSEQDSKMQGEIDKQLLADQTDLRSMQEYFGPGHPRIIQLNERIRMGEAYLNEYRAKVNRRLAELRQQHIGPMLLQMVRQRLAESQYQESMLRTRFEQARAEAVALIGERGRLDLMEHDLDFLRKLRDALLDKIASINLRQDHGDIRTAVVSEPTLPTTPVWPRWPLIALCSLMAGLGAGVSLIYVLDILDDRFRSPEEMQLELGAPLLALVRKMDELQEVGLAGLHVHVAPDSAASEAFRTLRTSLAFSGKETTRLVVSSPEPGDGKTTILANLAVSCWQAGKRTLMIDGDMRRPGLSSQMGLKGQTGLSDLLVSQENLDQAAPAHVQRLAPGLDFIPAGRRRTAPTELLTAPRMAELLAWAESCYDQIIIDSPPALAVNDASIIGRLVDGAVLVVQPAKNRRRLVTRAAEALTSVGVDLLGVVVNRIGDDKRDTIYADSAAYGYGYSAEDAQDAQPAEEPSETIPVRRAAPQPVADQALADQPVAAQSVEADPEPLRPIFEPLEPRMPAYSGSRKHQSSAVAAAPGGPVPFNRPLPSTIVPRRVA